MSLSFRLPQFGSWASLLACLSLLALGACEKPDSLVVVGVVNDAAVSAPADSSDDAADSLDQTAAELPDIAPPGCKSRADCSSAAPYCDYSTGSCVACMYGPQCGVGARCFDHTCVAPVACQSDKVCLGAGAVCDKTAGTCVDCLADGDCAVSKSGAAQVCRAHQCIPTPRTCKGSKDCIDLGQVCDNSASACVECTAAPDCATAEFCADTLCLPQVCLPGSATCSSLESVQACNADGSANVSTPCGPGAACENAKCVAQICKPGAHQCASAVVQTCNPAGTAWLDGSACGTAETCQDGACLTHVCLPASVTCEGAGLRTCAQDGLSTSDSACGEGQICDALGATSTCQAVVCAADKSTCDGAKVMLCNGKGTVASMAADCASASQVCKAGACLAQVCEPGSGTCGVGGLQVCNAEGLGWTAMSCGTGEICNNGACKPLVCSPSAKTCAGNQVMQCDALGLTAAMALDCGSAKVCKNGNCLDKVCVPGAVNCVDAGTIQTCSADGLALVPQACAQGTACDTTTCKPTICTPGVKSCSSGKVLQCDAKGLNQLSVEDCAASTKQCVAGACLPQVCTPNVILCNGNSLRTCSGDGFSYTDKACAADTSCDAGQCKPQVCKPLVKSCTGSKLLQCDGNGLGTALVEDCATAGKLCLLGACAEKLCDPGSVSCQGTALGICSADGQKWNVMPCDDKNPCTADICDAKASACAPGPTKDCADGLACTIDECNTWTGNCDHTASGGACDDGNACTSGDLCVGNQCVADPFGIVSTFAGAGKPASLDGPVDAASFHGPSGIVRASDGTLYVSDQGSHRIRKISVGGVVSTLAGDGVAGIQDGPGAKARFNAPAGLAIDASGNVLVADVSNHRIRMVAADGTVTTLAGSVLGAQDGPMQSATFNNPSAIVRSGTGDLFIADSGNHRIRRISPAGVVSTFSGSLQGYKDGPASAAQFYVPTGLALDPNGKLYVADQNNQRIRVIGKDGTVSTLAGSGTLGFLDGPGSSAQFLYPFSLALSPAGVLVVADASNHRIRAVFPDGSVTTIAGSQGGWTDGPGKQAKFYYPGAMAIDAAGAILVADRSNNRIRKITSNSLICQDDSSCTIDACDTKTGKCVFTALGNGKPCDDGTACTTGEACDAVGKCTTSKITTCDDGNLCTDDACDPYSGKCVFANNVAPCSLGDACILSPACLAGVCAAGQPMVTTIAGQATAGFQDGIGKAAMFQSLYGVARSAAGDLYLADGIGQRIRKLTVDGTVTTLAGNGTMGSADGPAAVATFNHPSGLAVDKAGNVFVVDSYNHRIRRITTGGMVSTFAGGSAGYLDGPGLGAQFNTPFGLTIDAFGNLYVGDQKNHRIRKITAMGVVSTFAGSGQPSYLDGPAISAGFNAPRGLSCDGTGNLFVADTANNRTRRISPQGVVSTVAGGVKGGYADGPAASALFNLAMGVGVDPSGNLVIIDTSNARIRLVDKASMVTTIAGSGSGQLVDGPGTQAAFLKPYAGLVDPTGTIVVADQSAVRSIAPQVKVCDDGSPCTIDSCDPKSGLCIYAKQAAGAPCSDGDACTTGDACDVGGTCTASPKPCNDANVCTTDACNPYTGVCENLANDLPCDDGSACTLSDHCASGKCATDAMWVTTLAGGSVLGYLDGTGANAAMSGPHGIAIDAAGNAYFADQGNFRIRKMSPNGAVTTLAGAGKPGYQDGPGSSALFQSPADVAIDALGNLYVADAFNHRIRKISPAGTVSTLAGSGQPGYQDGAGSSAQFTVPMAVAVDGAGKVYVADMGNNRIRTVAADGTVGTLAGSGKVGGANGPGSSASFSSPSGLAVDALGNVFVTEAGSHNVRHVAPNGNVDLVAGSGMGYADGKGLLAKFNGPTDVVVGQDGALYVTEGGNKRIRRIAKDSTVTTWAGSGTAEYKDGIATQAGFPSPQGLALAPDGALVVCDAHGLRRISSLGTVCTDGSACTTDVCDKVTAKCSFPVIADGAACDDGNACTLAEACTATQCSGGVQKACDDKDVCTIDSCDPTAGCQHAFSEAPGCCLPYALENHFDGKDTAGFTFTPMQANNVGWQVWSPAAMYQSASGVLYYGNKTNFNSGSTNSGTATSSAFAVPQTGATVSFSYYSATEGGTYDMLTLSVQPQSGGQAVVWTKGQVGSWQKVAVNLAAYAGQTVKLAFSFNSVDSIGNDGLGVLIDDVVLPKSCP